MGKVMTGALVIVGLWIGVEFFNHGPSGAFGGAFADFFESETDVIETRSTAQRAGDSVIRSMAEAEARRKKMLGE